MTRKPTPRELRDKRHEVKRALEARPRGRRQFVPTKQIVAAFKNVPSIDYEEWRADIDRYVDQDPRPRL